MGERCISWCQLIQVICCFISIMIVLYTVFDEEDGWGMVTRPGYLYSDYGSWKGKECTYLNPCKLTCGEMNKKEHNDYDWCNGVWNH